MTIAIIGAAGAIGKSIADAYHAKGKSVRLVGRDASRLTLLQTAGDEIISADVTSEEECFKALQGAEHAVYTLGLPYTKKDFAAYPAMMTAFVKAARRAGTKRILLITNIYPYGKPSTATVTEDHPRVPCSVKGQYRKEQEDVFLNASGNDLETISLRLPDFYGPNVVSSLYDGVIKAAIVGKTGNLLAPDTTPHEFVFTPDVGPVVHNLLENKSPVSGAFNFAGASITTQRKMAEMIYAEAAQPPKLRTMAPWMQNAVGLFVPILRELNEMRYLHETPVLLDDTKLFALLPNTKKTPYTEGIKRAVAAAKAG
jgi:nucleoside-diphosphate-sugar epimerase